MVHGIGATVRFEYAVGTFRRTLRQRRADRIDELATFVRAIGYDMGHNKKKYTAKDIRNLLKQIEGTPEEHLIRTATLRRCERRATFSPVSPSAACAKRRLNTSRIEAIRP